MTTVISVENLGKQYRLGTIGSGTLSHDLNRWWARLRGKPDPLLKIGQTDHGNRDGELIWALRDVSFEVKQGEVLGIIGRNGAGKSTLLKILSRVTAPTLGQIKVKGRIASLLEVGTGFHPELTGRENIFLNGAILGMSKREIAHKFDEIVAFSEVEKFIDTPVKRYSSGMYVRLAFAVAAHLEPEILLVDEVLAVGDAAFQKKCLGKMGDVAKEGRTVLFVSHNMAAIENLCSTSMFLDNGEVRSSGNTTDMITQYMKHAFSLTTVPLANRVERRGDGRILITAFHLEDDKGQRVPALRSGQDCQFVFTYECSDGLPKKNVTASFLVKTHQRIRLFIQRTNFTNQNFKVVSAKGQFVCRIPRLPLTAGQYGVDVFVAINEEPSDWMDDAVQFAVETGDFFGSGHPGMPTHGHVLVEADWSLRDILLETENRHSTSEGQ